MSAWISELVAWLLTYLLHSTVLIAGVWALCRCLPIRANAIREWLWTVALFGGLLTATLQSGLDLKPLAGTIHLPALLSSAATSAASVPSAPRSAGTGEQDSVPGRAGSGSILLESSGGLLGALLADPAAGATDAMARPSSAAAAAQGGSIVLRSFQALLIAALLLAGYTFVARLIRAPKRQPLRAGPLPELLARLRARAGMKRRVALSFSRQVVSPVAMGILRPEICVPERALTELSPDQLEAMLAHELAHLIRRDPVRLLLARAVEGLFFMQPLNRLALRRLFETVECRCDAFAIRQVGTGLSLAECLAEVAGWMTEDRRPVPALAMAQPGSHLTHRVSRLLKEQDALARDRGRRGLAPFLTLSLPLLVCLSPVVSTRGAEPAPEAQEAPEAPDSQEPSRAPRPELPVAPAPEGREPSISMLVAEAIGLLEEQLDLLAEELGALRVVVRGQAVSPRLLNRLTRLQGRVADLNQYRRIMAVWKTRMLRENGLVSTRPAKLTSGPWSSAR